MNKALIISLLTFACTSMAQYRGGDDLGNGGDVLLYTQNGRGVYELLDLYEGRMIRGFEPRKGLLWPGKTMNEFMTVLKAKDPSRACLYATWIKSFKKESELLTYSLNNLPDEGSTFIRPGSKLIQTIVQDPDTFRRGQARYFISKKVYNRMDDFNKTALIIHEMIYREGRLMNSKYFKNSVGVRTFNAFLFSRQILNTTDQTYQKMCQANGLPTTEDYCNSAHPIYKK